MAQFTPRTADRTIFNLGRPSSKLRGAGVEDKPIRLYGNKLLKKMRKHGFSSAELSGLTKALRNPIAVFRSASRQGAFAVLTELKTKDGNFLVSIELGKGGVDAKLMLVTSVYGKSSNKVVDWINKGYLRYVDKKKALKFLRPAAPIAATTKAQELYTAANVVQKFQNGNASYRGLTAG